MNKKTLFYAAIILAISAPLNLFSQKSVISLGDDRSLEIGGWVRSEFIYNSRATVEAVDGLFSLYPLKETLDANGADIYGNPSVAMSSIATRFSGTFRGTTIGNAAAEAYVEMDYTAKSTANSFMFRQGWIRLTWEDAQLLVGRAWHPLAFYSMPHVTNLSFGAPFFVFNRSEQIRYSYMPGNFTISATASYQGPYTSYGPNGRSDEYMRNTIIPEMSVAAMWQNETFKVGLVGNTKTLKPRNIVIGTNAITQSTDETLTTYNAEVFSEFKNDFVSLRLNGTYSQNNPESSMLGGYAVASRDAATGFEEYTPTQHINGWMSVEMGKKFKYGFFAGHSKYIGTLDPVVGSFYGRGNDIASISRISPRVNYKFTKFDVGAEIEYTKVWYGTPDNADFGKVKNSAPSNNTRIQVLAVYYF